MPISLRQALAVLLAAVSFGAAAQCVTSRTGQTYCPPAGSGCVTDGLNNIKCSLPDGGIVLNRFQEAMCGPGQCVINPLGEVYCSKQPKGYATVDQLGKAVCSGGCLMGSAGLCVTPSR